MGQLLEYEKQLLKETKLICTPFSELNIEGAYSTSSLPTDYGSSQLNELLNAPTTDSGSDDVFPSPLSDTFPSPSSDGFSSASDDVSYSNSFNELPKSNIKSRLALSLSISNNDNISQKRRKFEMQLPIEKRT